MIKRQTTINRIFKITGIGLHTGMETTLEFLPRREFGIAFVRNGVLISARYDMVNDTRLSTQLSSNGASVATIEHLAVDGLLQFRQNLLLVIVEVEEPCR
jgi:UDP-3-O-[3-hydroxymyristoyl] N-acetylglucosamine deacetylase